MTNQYVC